MDVSGRHVYPGLIHASTRIGLVEVNAVRATLDFAEVGPVTPEVRAESAFNPDSEMIPVVRANGVLTALTIPVGGQISGDVGGYGDGRVDLGRDDGASAGRSARVLARNVGVASGQERDGAADEKPGRGVGSDQREPRLRRVSGYKHLPLLRQALNKDLNLDNEQNARQRA